MPAASTGVSKLPNLATKLGCLPLTLTQETLSSQGWNAPTSQPGRFSTSALWNLSLKKVFMETSYVCRIVPLVINSISSPSPFPRGWGDGAEVPPSNYGWDFLETSPPSGHTKGHISLEQKMLLSPFSLREFPSILGALCQELRTRSKHLYYSISGLSFIIEMKEF